MCDSHEGLTYCYGQVTPFGAVVISRIHILSSHVYAVVRWRGCYKSRITTMKKTIMIVRNAKYEVHARVYGLSV